MVSTIIRSKALLALFVMYSIWLFAPPAYAQSILRGGISFEQGYDSNVYRDPDNEESEWTSTVSPIFDYSRVARRSRLSVRYTPGIVYSSMTHDTRVDHYAYGEYELQLSRNLNLNFSDRFVRAEDPYEDYDTGEDEISLSDRRGRRRFWSNSFSGQAGYTYGQQRVLEIGYDNHILENRDETYSDYVRHSPFAVLSHRFNHKWDARVEYRFVRGDFDEPPAALESDDLTSNMGDVYLYYSITPFTKVFGHFGYWQTDYDEGLDDYSAYIGATGLEHRYSPSLDLGLELGASLVERENFSNTDVFYLRASIDKRWARASWSFLAVSGLDVRSFSGTDDELGLSRYWSIATGFACPLTRSIEASLDFLYREDTYLERDPEVDEQYVEASGELSWAFARWYEVFVRYIFVNQDADIEADNYKDHRFFAGISAEKDLFKW